MSVQGQQQSSNDVCITSAITPTAARKQTFRHFAFVPLADVSKCSKRCCDHPGAQPSQRRSLAVECGHPDDESDRRHRHPARHLRARPHHRRPGRTCEPEGDAVDLAATSSDRSAIERLAKDLAALLIETHHLARPRHRSIEIRLIENDKGSRCGIANCRVEIEDNALNVG